MLLSVQPQANLGAYKHIKDLCLLLTLGVAGLDADHTGWIIQRPVALAPTTLLRASDPKAVHIFSIFVSAFMSTEHSTLALASSSEPGLELRPVSHSV